MQQSGQDNIRRGKNGRKHDHCFYMIYPCTYFLLSVFQYVILYKNVKLVFFGIIMMTTMKHGQARIIIHDDDVAHPGYSSLRSHRTNFFLHTPNLRKIRV